MTETSEPMGRMMPRNQDVCLVDSCSSSPVNQAVAGLAALQSAVVSIDQSMSAPLLRQRIPHRCLRSFLGSEIDWDTFHQTRYRDLRAIEGVLLEEVPTAGDRATGEILDIWSSFLISEFQEKYLFMHCLGELCAQYSPKRLYFASAMNPLTPSRYRAWLDEFCQARQYPLIEVPL